MSEDALVGVLVDEFTVPVEAGKVREFARAIHDPAPRYRDPAAAAAEGFASVPAPLTFAVVAGHDRDPLQTVRVLGLELDRVVVGEVEWEYVRPLVVGDLLYGRRTVVDVRECLGARGGAMRLFTLETVFIDAAGDVVLRQRETLIETGDRAA